MTLLQSYTLPHLPADITVHIGLVTSLQNAPFLRQQLLSGNTAFEYAFLDARLCVSTLQILSAVYRAVRDAQDGHLRTRNVHSEIVYSMSGGSNISEAFRRWGMGDESADIVVVKVLQNAEGGEEAVKEHLEEVIEGKWKEFCDEEIQRCTDLERVRKYYKLGAGEGVGKKGRRGGETVDVARYVGRELEVAVLGVVALRGVS